MQNLTTNYLTRAELWLCITTLAYFLMNGAQIFETTVLVPRWTAAAPESFQLFKGRYAIDLKTFWIVIHSIHELTFIAAIIFCWKIDPVRTWLLVLFTIHFAVRVWTIIYFAPNIMDFQKIANGAPAPADLLQRVAAWRTLNYIRVGMFIAVSLGLLPLCVKVLTMLRGA
ncbi:MAG: transposase [Sphingobacteriales bacterium]|nr:MAG: transposase [Sphingobacteriales bacterium]